MKKKIISLLLCLTLLTWVPSTAMAANSADATVIESVSIKGITIPFVGEKPDYSSELGGTDYTYDDQLAGDHDVFEGKWWYDETTGHIVSPNEAFKLNHVYTIAILLVPNDGYEFKVDEGNNPLLKAKVNGFPAAIDKDLTGKSQAFIEYTFSPCSEKNRVNEVAVSIDPPKTGEEASFSFFRIFPGEDVTYSADTNTSQNYHNGVCWYDKTSETYLSEGDTFVQGHDYGVRIAIQAQNDYFFATNTKNTSEVKVFINDKRAGTGNFAGANPGERIILYYTFTNENEVVSSIQITDITEPVVGEHPNYTVLTANDSYWINGVFWVDVTDGKEVTIKETDTFLEGHTYQIQVWLRTADGYVFHTDADGYLDVYVIINGNDANYIPAFSEISAELFYDFEATVKDTTTDTESETSETDSEPNTDDTNTESDIQTDTETTDDTDTTETDTSTESDTESDTDKADVILGDVDGDGFVTMTDVVMLQKAIAKLTTFSEDQITIADVNFDSKNTMEDVVTIQKYIAKLITSFETGKGN